MLHSPRDHLRAEQFRRDGRGNGFFSGPASAAQLELFYFIENYGDSPVSATDTLTDGGPTLSESRAIETEHFTADISYQTISVSAYSSSAASPENENSGLVNLSARWTDEWTISAPGIADGTPGTIFLSFAFSGSLAESHVGLGHTLASYYLATTLDSDAYMDARFGADEDEYDFQGNTIGDFSGYEYSFYFGVPVQVSVVLEANAESGFGTYLAGSGNAEVADLSLTLDHVTVKRNGAILDNAAIDTASGTTLVVAIPEPGAVLLLSGAGVFSLLHRRRCRPSTQSVSR